MKQIILNPEIQYDLTNLDKEGFAELYEHLKELDKGWKLVVLDMWIENSVNNNVYLSCNKYISWAMNYKQSDKLIEPIVKIEELYTEHNMKTITLNIEQAKQLYETNPEYRETLLNGFSDEELGIDTKLKDWEESDFIGTFYPTNSGNVYHQNNILDDNYVNVPTEKHAKSILAFAKLSMLLADLGDETNVNWETNDKKFNIERYLNMIVKTMRYKQYEFLAFKTEETRDAFYKKHKQLILEYFML